MIIKVYFTYKHDEHTVVEHETHQTRQKFIQDLYVSKGFWYKPNDTEFFVPWHKINSFEIKK